MKPVILALTVIIILQATDTLAKDKRKNGQFKNMEAAVVAVPQDKETCFSPIEPCGAKLAAFIASAKQSIDVAIYDINLEQVVHQLIVQAVKMPVRIVIDRRQSKGPHSLVPTLLQSHAKVRYGHQRGIMHNKFTIIDNKMLETGSFNYTTHASEANNENQLYLEISTVIDRYKKRFETIWEQAEPAN
jgi:phosphatidylserine/phosphatidylglycerophosphate/cardiolipin synthase-like enzyme